MEEKKMTMRNESELKRTTEKTREKEKWGVTVKGMKDNTSKNKRKEDEREIKSRETK